MCTSYRRSYPVLLALALFVCAGCSTQASTPGLPTAPSPLAGTPAATAPTSASVGRPAVTTRPPGQSLGAATDSSIYLWPTYLPPGMTPAPAESLVARDTEVGADGLGFYTVTLNGDGKKLAIGGGGLDQALPLSGEERRVEAGGRSGRLIASGERREIIFDVPKGKLFVYSAGLSEGELLKVAGSLQSIDVRALRDLAGAR
ncbi:MAG: hypothetical protein IPO81_07770 [Kouleothrix sp.]|nr:hypothetical protein [Kouleothrix sp.]